LTSSFALPSRDEATKWITANANNAPLLLIAAFFIYLVTLREGHFPEEIQLGVGWGCVVIMFAMRLFAKCQLPPWRFIFLALSLFIALRYIWWRTFDTLIFTNIPDFIGMATLYFAEVYSLLVHLMQLFVNLWPLDRGKSPLPADRKKWPTVDIFIPTYTEDEEIVRVTAMAATQIDYPKEKIRIYILDDGGTLARRNDPNKADAAWARRLKLKEIAAQLGVEYLTRETNRAAKAGNVNHALTKSSGDLVLFLDCDHVPTSNILQETVGHFVEDEKLFLVQTPHFFCNSAPTERSIGGDGPVPDESEMFYRVIHTGLDFWNSSYFCGSAALLRRKHLEEIGGLSGTSITEDAETAFELHRRGYRSRYVNRPMVCGLAASTYSDYVLQHTRWAQGSVQIMMLHNPLFASGLSIAQRVCYLNACLFWFFGIVRIIYFISPVAFLLFGLSIYHAAAPQILAYSLPHMASTLITASFLFGRTRRAFFSEIYESIQSVFLMPAVMSTIRHPHKPSFKVTPKGIGLENNQLNALSFFFFAIFVLNFAAVSIGAVKFWTQPLYRDVIALTLIWAIYNLVLTLWSLGALWEKRQTRSQHRLMVVGQAMIQFPRVNQRVSADLIDLSLSGIGFSGKFEFEVKDRERVVVEAASADGLVSYFEAEITRGISKGPVTVCGARFLTQSQTFPDVVHYVYGDSGRWEDVWAARSRKVPQSRVLAQLIGMGFRGAWICLTITLRITWQWLNQNIVSPMRTAYQKT
jgi:cellulose synthase (UDP-forming)